MQATIFLNQTLNLEYQKMSSQRTSYLSVYNPSRPSVRPQLILALLLTSGLLFFASTVPLILYLLYHGVFVPVDQAFVGWWEEMKFTTYVGNGEVGKGASEMVRRCLERGGGMACS